jgi:hypothetical protein
LLAAAIVGVWPGAMQAAEPDFQRDVLRVLDAYCLNCHDAGDTAEVGLNLERFATAAAVSADRNVWLQVFEKVESRQMPPPKRDAQPSDEERTRLLAWIRFALAQPDPALAARDPGKPMLRRLNRLEYNNTVRDLLGLDRDVFMFSERLPVVRSYFQPTTGRMPDIIHVRTLEYGARTPVLLPRAGLPAENRAEHGYSNRGDAMNMSPLLMEKYLALAADIAASPDLAEFEFYDSFLAPPRSRFPAATAAAPPPAHRVVAAGDYAGSGGVRFQADGNSTVLYQFRTTIRDLRFAGRSGVLNGETGAVAIQPGESLGVTFGRRGEKTLLLKSATAMEIAEASALKPVSGRGALWVDAADGKSATLEFVLQGAPPSEGLAELGIVVVRPVRTGMVSATVRFADGRSQRLEQDASATPPLVFVPPAPGSGRPTAPPPPKPATNTNIFFSFHAPADATIVALTVEDTAAEGRLVLDELGFVTARLQETRAAQSVPPGDPAEWRAEATRRIAAFLPRAFRRQVDEAERQPFVALYDRVTMRGGSFETAMRSVLRAVLVSPPFLYLAEDVRPAAPKVRPLDGQELASRLSYFLWSSAPDAELRRLASTGELTRPDVLTAQGARMLRDPKVKELSESFAVQWLRLDQLFSAKPDPTLFGEFYAGSQGKDTLHMSMLIEALLFFETMLIENRSVLDLVTADHSYLNERLRRLYGIDERAAVPPAAVAGLPAATAEVTDASSLGAPWRRTRLPNPTRGGVMTMAGPLTVTSLPTRTSPVKRGAWLLETIFNRPPQEPKFAFALKDEPPANNRPLSVRERFEAHRTQPACYSCHVRLDPPGFALEAFSPIGELRTEDGGAAVDASGEWNGVPFAGPAEFKAAVMRRPEEFVRGFIEHLLAYALGRKLEHHDMTTVEEIQAAVRSQGYRFQALLAEIVRSYPFRHVRNVPAAAPEPAPLRP